MVLSTALKWFMLLNQSKEPKKLHNSQPKQKNPHADLEINWFQMHYWIQHIRLLLNKKLVDHTNWKIISNDKYTGDG